MPSHQPMKTYMKKTRVRMNTSVNSVDAVNALFVENLTKRFKSRKKAKIELKELPPQGPTQLTDDSLKVETNDTFDRLVKGKVYNEVKIVCNILKFNSSNSDTSVTYRSPIMTRRRKKTTALVTEVDSEESSTVDKPVRKNVLVCSSLKSNLSKSTSRSYRSSIMTRRRKKSTEEANSNENSEKSSTLDKPVTKSLSIEKESKHNFSTLSYIKLPRITEDQVMNNNQDPIFSDTFRERAFVHSSTPYVNTRRSKIVEDCISPIVSNPKSVSNPVSPVAKSDSSSSSELIEKSFDQIRKWDKNFPLEGQGVKVKRPRGRPRKLPLDSPKDKDWKLKCEVKVCVENCIPEKEGPADFQGFTCDEQRTGKELSDEFSQTVLDYSRDNVLRGFTPEEQSNSGEYSQECHNSFVSYNHDYTKRRQRLPKPSINSPKEAKSRTRRRSTRFTKVDFKRKSVRRKGLRTREKRQSFVTSRRPTASVAAKKTQAANSRKSKMKKCVDVTDDILSEKEMSYSHSESFDFSSSSSRVQIEELKDKEICLPKKNSVITVDLDDFDKFMQSYYLKDQTDDNKGEIKPETNSNSHNNRSLDFLISPPRPSTSTLSSKSDSKIVILSDITLGFNKKPLTDLNKSVEVVHHDHSYTNTPPSTKPPQCSILEPHLDLSDIIESSEDPIKPTQFKKPTKSLKLKPGKSYRRSLSLLRRSSVLVDVNVGCPEDCVCFKCMFKEKLNLDSSRKSQIVPVGRKSIGRSLLESYARSHLSYVQQQEEGDFVEDLAGSVQSLRKLSLNARKAIVEGDHFEVTAKELVLRRCGQREILGFEECYPTSALQNCHKIGEGVYGEVFLYRNADGGTSVMKIIPIEGDLIVNGERQKKFEEILSEIVIAMELSNLRSNKKNSTTCFSEVQKVRCTQGNYPDRLVDLWQLYDETKGSENDSPQMFSSDQLYIVLELANGGRDLESFVFNNALQAYAMFKQTACALAVAESELHFEHRDLHWGNVLLTTVDKSKTLRFRLDGCEIEVETAGVEIAIIDFTLSRIEFDEVVIFNDLSLDSDLFVAKGDYQFEIYRLMQKSNGNEWQHFEPYTNVLWLHYILDKIPAFRYKNTKSKVHKTYLTHLRQMKEEVLSYNCVTDFVKEKFF